jgi:hypothetical protein
MHLSKEFLDGLSIEIPKMVEAFSNPNKEQTESRKKWNYDHAFDFLYGETIGWIEGYIIRSFIEIYKREPSVSELSEISSVIVLYADQIKENFKKIR